jgi:hypothetical protein
MSVLMIQYATSRLLSIPASGPSTPEEITTTVMALDILRIHYGEDMLKAGELDRVLRVECIGQPWIQDFLYEQELQKPRKRASVQATTFLIPGWFEAHHPDSLTAKQLRGIRQKRARSRG